MPLSTSAVVERFPTFGTGAHKFVYILDAPCVQHHPSSDNNLRIPNTLTSATHHSHHLAPNTSTCTDVSCRGGRSSSSILGLCNQVVKPPSNALDTWTPLFHLRTSLQEGGLQNRRVSLCVHFVLVFVLYCIYLYVYSRMSGFKTGVRCQQSQHSHALRRPPHHHSC